MAIKRFEESKPLVGIDPQLCAYTDVFASNGKNYPAETTNPVTPRTGDSGDGGSVGSGE